ncbi:MAG: TetR family transcriptional regulator [Dermatophilaceae bacterium]
MTPREALLTRAIGWFAENGVGDTSLRTLAGALGTSHRMLIYHFGSREGLLGAVVEAVERAERDALAELMGAHEDPYAAGAAFWAHVCAARVFVPLFFELSGLAMQGRDWGASLRRWLADGWTAPMAAGYRAQGHPAARAEALARLSVAAARGLLFELAVTGDRAAADAAMAELTAMVRAAQPA